MEELYRAENRFMTEVLNIVPKEVIEKRFIIGFLQELPLNKLKQLVNFKEINPKSETFYIDNPIEREREFQLRNELRSLNQIEFRAKLTL